MHVGSERILNDETLIKQDPTSATSNRRGVITVTECTRVLPKKLTGPQIVKKFPAFYGTQMFITAFTRAHTVSYGTKLYSSTTTL
jgi:hypothetical protein